MDQSAVQQTQSFGPTEINWDKLDKSKFYVVGAGLFTGITVALYPVTVIKTRLQVATKDSLHRNAFSIIKNTLKTDGVPGLYRGFGTVVTGAVPVRMVYLTALETTKAATLRMVEPFKLSEATQAAISNGVAGLTASCLSQAVFVPVDVVSQKLMVQGYSGHTKYNGGLDVVRKVLKVDGIRGLYRGFGLSVATYSPGSAVWWASYGASQRFIWRYLGYGTETEGPAPSGSTIMLVQATGGISAGAISSFITTPLDTIKTRLQVMGLENRSTAKEVVKALIKEEGWQGFYRGLGPRFFSMSAWGTSMILSYEYLRATYSTLEDPLLLCCRFCCPTMNHFDSRFTCMHESKLLLRNLWKLEQQRSWIFYSTTITVLSFSDEKSRFSVNNERLSISDIPLNTKLQS